MKNLNDLPTFQIGVRQNANPGPLHYGRITGGSRKSPTARPHGHRPSRSPRTEGGTVRVGVKFEQQGWRQMPKFLLALMAAGVAMLIVALAHIVLYPPSI